MCVTDNLANRSVLNEKACNSYGQTREADRDSVRLPPGAQYKALSATQSTLSTETYTKATCWLKGNVGLIKLPGTWFGVAFLITEKKKQKRVFASLLRPSLLCSIRMQLQIALFCPPNHEGTTIQLPMSSHSWQHCVFKHSEVH